MKYLEREDYTEQEWMNVVYDQLSRNLPIVYGGFTKQREGHSFVLDGYDAEGLVHVNWGWNGDQNGYYDIAILDPVGYKFTQMQEAVINIDTCHQPPLRRSKRDEARYAPIAAGRGIVLPL